MERFTKGERAILAVFLVAAAAAGVFAWTNFAGAFPEASLDFRVNRSTSRPVAEAFLAAHAPKAAEALTARHHAAIFRVENDAKVYLEREVGLERMGELVKSREVRLWSWAHRYFRALDKEEVAVSVTPEGEVAAFSHVVAEEAPGASLEEAEARGLASAFLAKAFSVQPDRVTFIESHREDRPARRDWTFTFERAGWTAASATYRLQIEVHGDEVASYREFLKIPDAWTQSYQRLRSANETTALVAVFGIVLTLVAAVIVILREARRGNVKWRLVLGLTAVSFVLFFALALNNLPIATYSFETTESWGGFLASELLSALGGAGMQALLIFLVVAAGEPLFRARFGNHLRVGALFSAAGWRSKRFTFGLVLGYCLAALFIAYQVAFYLVGKRFGAWNPADVPFDNLLNTWFPWLAVLFIGFYPAVSEEFMSRVFSIPLVEKLTRSRVAAVVVPALIWGFAHASYPAQPFFIRGVEVSVAGLLVGIVLYRFGVLPCLVWHYVVDAGYTSMLLVRSGNLYLAITAIAGTGALLVPLVIALVAAWRRGGYVPDSALENAAEPAPPQPEVVVTAPTAAIEAPSARWLVPVGTALLVLGVVLAWRAPDAGKGIGLRHDPEFARQSAETFLRTRGVDTNSWLFVVVARGDVLSTDARRYLLEHGGVEQVRRYAVDVPLWQVRAFRPEEREEWQIAVDDSSGNVVRYHHVLREEAQSASLSVEEARALAERSLTADGLDVTALTFKEAKSEKRPGRVDHVFTYKDPTRSVAEAEYLIDVTVQGDSVDAKERRLKLPEEWERQRDKGTLLHYGLIGVRIAFLAWLVVHALHALYWSVRQGSIARRPVWVTTAVFALVLAVAAVLNYPIAWQSYDTAWPAALFRTSLVIGLTIGVVVQGAAIALAVAAVLACYPAGASALNPAARRQVAGSSVGATLAALGSVLTVGGLVALARSAVPRGFPDAPIEVPSALATAVPALTELSSSLLGATLLVAAVTIAAHLVSTIESPLLRCVFWVGALLALVPGGVDSTELELGVGLVRSLVMLVAVWALCRHALGANPVAYLLAAGWLAALPSASVLLEQQGWEYRGQGVGIVLVALVVTWWWLRRKPATQAAQG